MPAAEVGEGGIYASAQAGILGASEPNID
jgi:hypothetical protein